MGVDGFRQIRVGSSAMSAARDGSLGSMYMKARRRTLALEQDAQTSQCRLGQRSPRPPFQGSIGRSS